MFCDDRLTAHSDSLLQGCLYGKNDRSVNCAILFYTMFTTLKLDSKGAIGILSRTDMDYFAQIFVAYQLMQNSPSDEGRFILER